MVPAAVFVDEPLWLIVIKSAFVIFVVMTAFAYVLLAERKLIGRFQVRYGPNRTGPFGLLQPLADVVKLIFKEDFVPAGANRVLFAVAPAFTVVAAVGAIAVIPYGDGTVELFGQEFNLVGADINIGILFLFALSGIGFYSLILAGWASGNKYSLLGAARTAAQLVSYEVVMGLSIIGVIMMAQTLSLVEVVNAQQDTLWYVVFQPLGFLIFLVAGVAETNRAPFDLPEAESELVAGYHTEYAGLKFAMFFLAEYVNIIIITAFGATLFLGGYAGPVLPGFLWLAIKVSVLLFLFIWLRATLPRLRYDQLMQFGWKVLLPLATANLVITAIVVALGFAN
ncbi:MAG: NADH-quinone oxidoreductase subunit NuoH [Thermoleophilia bacterium]|nr:NADH-quinone oxidoreductase subunit NuoH [Thermoleophilia bacterium]